MTCARASDHAHQANVTVPVVSPAVLQSIQSQVMATRPALRGEIFWKAPVDRSSEPSRLPDAPSQ